MNPDYTIYSTERVREAKINLKLQSNEIRSYLEY